MSSSSSAAMTTTTSTTTATTAAAAASFPASSSFLGLAFRELLEEDGLLVLGRGLGLRLVLAKFLQLFSGPRTELS